MTPAARERTFDDIVRQAHAERARYVGESLATALVAVIGAATTALRVGRQVLTPATERWPQQHGLRQRQQRAAQSRRVQLLTDVGH